MCGCVEERVHTGRKSYKSPVTPFSMSRMPQTQYFQKQSAPLPLFLNCLLLPHRPLGGMRRYGFSNSNLKEREGCCSHICMKM